MNNTILETERAYLAGLLEAVQRCVFFIDASDRKLDWPLRAEEIRRRKRDVDLFETLAAINERFAKLQDTLGAAMRHAALLAGEPVDTFLQVLSFFEKCGVIDSVETWRLCRTARNLAAREYETDYATIAEHFNALHELLPILYRNAANFARYCKRILDIEPETSDYAEDFRAITSPSMSCPHDPKVA